MSLFNYIVSAFAFGIIFLLGATGEIITEKVGHLNLGIPGIMSVGAAGGCLMITLFYGKNVPGPIIVIMAVLSCFFFAGLMGLLFSFLTVTLKTNQNVTGLALTTFGVGLTKFMMAKINRVGSERYLSTLKFFRAPFNSFDNSLKYCGVLAFFAIAVAIASHYVLYKTKTGLHLRAIGENPATADAVGINVTAYKYLATVIGSGIAGIGGFYYVMDYAGSQESYLTIEALGWLSVALVIFSLWKPLICIAGSFVFGLLYILNAYIANLFNIVIPMALTPLIKLLPYAVTIIVLIITSVRMKRENQPPSGLGVTYFREER